MTHKYINKLPTTATCYHGNGKLGFGLIGAPSFYLESPFPGDLEDEGPYILRQKWFGLPGHDPDRLLPWTRPLTAATHSAPVTSDCGRLSSQSSVVGVFFTLLLFKMLNLLLDHSSVIFPDRRSDHASGGVTWKDFNQFFICRFKHFRKKKKKKKGLAHSLLFTPFDWTNDF